MDSKKVSVLILFLFWGAVLWGQVTSGTISGTVKDSTGAVLPGVTVAFQNTDTGIQRTLTTDNRGYYAAPNLTLGRYEITASISGFQTEVRRGITLNVGQNAVIDFTLAVGAVTERVEVTAEAPLIETTTASVAGLVNERQVQDLPLNARNLIELAPLYAGVAFATTGERSASKGMATKLTISGTRYNSSLFQLDGVDINDSTNSAGGAAGILMGAETIREFNVITNGYSAEYGKHTGGVFNAVTKSGTNALHGSAFEFLRNDKLDAREFFDRDPDHPLVRSDPPPFKRNQFGASIGGPIVKDRSFFFGSYEGLRERLGQTNTFTVPSLGVRQGQVPGQVNPVPINPVVRPYLDSYPLPNGDDLGDGTAEWIASRSLPTGEDFFTVRGDHTFSESDSLFGRYTFDDAENTPNAGLNTSTLNESRAHYAVLGETRMFSPAVISQFLLGFSRTIIAQANVPISGATFPRLSFTSRDSCCGNISVPSFAAWGGNVTFPRIYLLNMFQFKEDVFYTRGSHSFKFGFNAQRLQFNHNEVDRGNGTFAFNSIADFLQGIVNNFNALTLNSDPTNYVRQTIYGIYAQDDYKISSRLTLNLGLRYEFTTTPFDKYGRVANLMDFRTPGQTPDKLIYGNPFMLNPSLKNFAPRVGLAWDPTGSGKTSIRAGAGIFHDQINAGTFILGLLTSPPFFVVGNILTRGRANFPDVFFTQQDLLVGSANIEGYQYYAAQPTVYKYSLDIQREVLPNTSVTLGFSASRGVHLQRVLNMNMPVAQVRDGRLFIASNAPLVHPAFARVRPRFTDAASNYYAFRLSVTRRFSSGLQFQGSYTLSKTTDDGSNWTGSSDWGNSPGQARYLAIKDKGLAPFDIRHSFVANFTYDLPGQQLAGAARKVLGGWQMSGIVSLQGGNPFNVSTGVQPSFMRSGFVGDYPDVAPGVTEYRYDTRNPERYFDPAPFVLPPGFSNTAALGGAFVGNAGRSILIGPGIAKFDFVLVKRTQLTERVSLQFRSEFFNLFNRANFSLPAGRIFANAAGTISGSVGRITDTNGSSRQIQFGLRLVF